MRPTGCWSLPEKRLLVVLRHAPAHSERNAEALRVAVGLTIANPQVAVLLLDGAAALARAHAIREGGRQDIVKHWQALAELGVARFVEAESLLEQGIAPAEVSTAVKLLTRADVGSLLAEAVVLVY